MRTGAILFIGLLLAAAASAQEPGLDAAREPVEKLYTALLSSMKGGETLAAEDRSSLIRDAVAEAYDIEFMASRALGRHWRELDDEKRAVWTETFRALTVHTYADRFNRFSGQSFDVGEVSAASRGTAVVRTHIVSPGNEPVEIRYRMRPLAEKGWRIVDIYLNGTISELALRRSEYSSVIKREGFDHLVDALREKVEPPTSD
jgi:phospholipid transport system substrate-binding protein